MKDEDTISKGEGKELTEVGEGVSDSLSGYSPLGYREQVNGLWGEDLILARAARLVFPFSVECKNQERVNLWEAYDQANANAGQWEPIVFLKKNHRKPLVLLDAHYFLEMIGRKGDTHNSHGA